MSEIKKLIEEAKQAVCFEAEPGFFLRKELKDVTQEDLNKQWNILTKLLQIVEDKEK